MTVLSASFFMNPGGKGANQAVAAPKGTSAVLNGMLLCYLAGLGLLIAAR